jgi:hypothetical protein
MPTIKLEGEDYIYERISDDGRLTSYQVKIRRKGFPSHIASFEDLDDARRFVRQVLSDQDRGHRIDRLAGHRNTVGTVIDDAVKAIETSKRVVKGWESELYRLKAFRRDNVMLCSTALSDATEDLFEDWIVIRRRHWARQVAAFSRAYRADRRPNPAPIHKYPACRCPCVASQLHKVQQHFL